MKFESKILFLELFCDILCFLSQDFCYQFILVIFSSFTQLKSFHICVVKTFGLLTP